VTLAAHAQATIERSYSHMTLRGLIITKNSPVSWFRFVSFQGGGNDERSSPGVAGGAVQVFLGYVVLVYVGQVVRSEKLTSWGARGEKFWPGSKGACSESSNPV